MLEFNIPKTKKETCTTFPSFMLARVEPWLERNNIEYKLFIGEEIPDELPHGYVFKGHKSRRHVACLVTKLNSKELHDVIERMIDMHREDI